MSYFNTYKRLIETAVARQDFDHDPEELYKPISYVLAMGGKRLRPALCLAGNELFGGSPDDAMMPALGIELFHNFSLVHDDVMDKAELRRGKKTVHQKWDLNSAILSGDAMLIKAYQYLLKVDKDIVAPVLKCFTNTALELCEGQQMDINFEKSDSVAEEDYLAMIQGKTAVLLGAALKIGALTAKATTRQANTLYHFGTHAGMAFQVQDDLLDAFGASAKVGKQCGGDIMQDKKTLLMIYAREADATGWEKLQQQNLNGEPKVKAYKQFFNESGAQQKTEAKRDELLQTAFQELENARVTNTELKEELRSYTQWLAHREH